MSLQSAARAFSRPVAPSTMTSPGVFRPRLTRLSRSARQAASLSPPMFLTANRTFWPSCRTPSATRSEIDVAFLSSRTRTTVPSRMSLMIGSSFKERAFQSSQSPFTLRQTRLTVSFPTALPNKPMVAADLCKHRPKPHTIWHLDEVDLKIDGRMVNLWRAVDAEGEVLDVLVQTRRNKRAALKLMCKLLKKYGFVPDKLVTDELRSNAAAASHLGITKRHERGRWRNNRAENSHQPTRRRERKNLSTHPMRPSAYIRTSGLRSSPRRNY